MNIELRPRLRAVAELVPPGRPFADIGTDHALLPAALVLGGRVPSAIAADVAEGPVRAAEQTVDRYGLVGRVEVRLGSGLEVLAPGEVATVVLAGVGGPLIRTLLESAPDVVARLKCLVLQPMVGSRSVREWCRLSGWCIADERLVEDDGRVYEVILAERDGSPPPRADYPPELEDELGPLLLRRRPPLFDRFVRERIDRFRRQAEGMRRSDDPVIARDRERVLEHIARLEGLLS